MFCACGVVVQAEEEARKNDPNKKEVEIDADLRANYYYPTCESSERPAQGQQCLPRSRAVPASLFITESLRTSRGVQRHFPSYRASA